MQNEITKSRQEYIKRINYVMDFVEKNLDSDLSLEQLSKKAFYSPYHFHRIFSAIVGESINEFINRKRIERIASILLVGNQKPLNELIYKYGFNSSSSFARVFKKFYGVSPTAFKTKGKDIVSKIGILPVTLDTYVCSIDNIKKWIDMNAHIEVKKLQEIKLAGITHIGKFDEIGNTYERLFKWASQKRLLNSKNLKAITIYHDNPKVTQMSKVRLSTCITIDKDISAEGEVKPILIQSGHYAVGHFEITADLFQKAWDSMCVWVLENGYNFRDSDYFEIYLNDHKTHPEQKFVIDICIPVKNSHKKGASPQNNIVENSDSNLGYYKEQIKKGKIQKDYNQLITYIKTIRTYFIKEYAVTFKVGNLNQGNMDFTYFSITPASLKKLKLKFVIIFNHVKMQFEICLSGQNKQIRKKYWRIFKHSDWDVYHIHETGDGLSIIDHILIQYPDFDDPDTLTQQIEIMTMKFVKDITNVLDG
ncbi:AraC family transcriptional regulator [Aquimarina sediminis]|uniref:AraC family transcriptional regulator n=1 Tax=Aquimarina sediminis TaxID=2070536 RepID=UPI000CA00C9D|nr:AraC family transcriptional regulator [Aquimarina sediminis]